MNMPQQIKLDEVDILKLENNFLKLKNVEGQIQVLEANMNTLKVQEETLRSERERMMDSLSTKHGTDMRQYKLMAGGIAVLATPGAGARSTVPPPDMPDPNEIRRAMSRLSEVKGDEAKINTSEADPSKDDQTKKEVSEDGSQQ